MYTVKIRQWVRSSSTAGEWNDWLVVWWVLIQLADHAHFNGQGCCLSHIAFVSFLSRRWYMSDGTF